VEREAGLGGLAGEDLSIHVGDRNIDVPPPTGAAALHQLPPPPPNFTGRRAELADLEAAKTSRGIYISGLRGMDGAGKTALALVLAHRLAAHYPDAQFYLDLRGTSLRPLSAAQAMAHVIRAYHPTARLPEKEDELADLYRTVLDGQRALLLLDNVARRSQVEPLLPPRTCLLLVTSPRRFGLPALHELNLHALPFEHAEELLLRIAPRLNPSPDPSGQSADPSGQFDYPGGGLQGPQDKTQGGQEAKALPKTTPLSHKTMPLLRLPRATEHLDRHAGQAADLLPKTARLSHETMPLLPLPSAPGGRLQNSDDGTHGGVDTEPLPGGVPRQVSSDSPADPDGRSADPDGRSAAPSSQVQGRDNRVHARDGGGALTELAHLCGCLPLALRLAASVLAEREDLGVDEVVERLWAGQAQQEPVEAALRLSYGLLDEDLQKHWRALAVFLGAFNRTAAASVWGVDSKRADVILGCLLRYGLIECDAQTRRYHLHDRARECAEAWLGNRERVVAERRHALHYAWVLDMANEFYLQGGEGVLRGLALFDRERANVEAGQAWAATHARRDEETARLCSAYPGTGAYILDVRLRARELIRWLEAAADAAHQVGDRRGEGIHLGNTGNAYSDLGEAAVAIDYYEQALAIAQETGDRRNEGAWLGNMGDAYRSLGKVKVAIEHYERALDIARDIGDRRDQGNALSHLGLAYSARGDGKKAIQYTESALEIFQSIQSPYAAQTREQLIRLRQASKKKWWQFWKKG
jgi:tetratricopeptide (TPR) repeat protein